MVSESGKWEWESEAGNYFGCVWVCLLIWESEKKGLRERERERERLRMYSIKIVQMWKENRKIERAGSDILSKISRKRERMNEKVKNETGN